MDMILFLVVLFTWGLLTKRENTKHMRRLKRDLDTKEKL